MIDPAAAPVDPAVAEPAPEVPAGYCVRVCVYADGTYGVAGPEPLAPEAEQGEVYDSVSDALKGVLAVIKDNPAAGDDQAQFNAGYAQ